MNDTDRQEPGAGAEHADSQGEIRSRYDVVPYAEIAKDEDLYSFRAEMGSSQAAPGVRPAQPQMQPQRQAQAQRRPLLSDRKNLMMVAGIGGLAFLFIVLLIVVLANRQEPALPFIDLGPNNIASAGLGSRLIAKWDGKAEYELHIDPLVPQQIPGFSAVASNSPRPLSVNLRLKDASGAVVCQKEILFPFDPAAAADPDQVQPLLPQKTSDGDTVQNVAGEDGQIAEIVVNGSLLCPVKLYNRLASWDFTSSFPDLAGQEDWMRHEEGVAANLRRRAAEARARELIPRVRPLPAPIDDDDVIVSDNPSKGTVETRSGRVFYIGRNGLNSRAPEWQVFPAAIHFHCDVKAICTLTRANASAPLQARLMH
jgi:hypothetical protein